jgi:hypothetical protein
MMGGVNPLALARLKFRTSVSTRCGVTSKGFPSLSRYWPSGRDSFHLYAMRLPSFSIGSPCPITTASLKGAVSARRTSTAGCFSFGMVALVGWNYGMPASPARNPAGAAPNPAIGGTVGRQSDGVNSPVSGCSTERQR